MAKRYFFDLTSGQRVTPDGGGILLSSPEKAKEYGTRLLAEQLVANAGKPDQELIMKVRDACGDMLFRMSMEMHVEVSTLGA